jgi:hypothetical protein
MRPLILLSLSCVVGPGCDFHKESPALSVLVVDRAELGAVDRSGQHWCRNDEAPSVDVTVGFGGLVTMTPVLQSATPVWNTPTVMAPDDAWQLGIYVEARGECDGERFSLGAVILHPPVSVVERGGLLLQNVGGLRSLRLRFARAPGFGDSVVAFYPYAVTAGAYVNDDTNGWPVYDDGSDAWDDGSWGGDPARAN